MSRIRLALVVAVLVALAGCAGTPAGVDGNLTDDWSAMPEARVVLLPVDACDISHTNDWLANQLDGGVLYSPGGSGSGCDKTHIAETVYARTTSGARAGGTSAAT